MSAEISDIAIAREQPRGRPWQKGVSGNPGGRPRLLAGVRDAARLHTAAAILVLKAIMDDRDAPAAARISAAKELLDRAWGRSSAVPVAPNEEPGARGAEHAALEQEIDAALEGAQALLEEPGTRCG